eukprot:COSAG01_NODE_1759_length_9301_cov_24.140622_10_plen_448_part_00
MSGRDPFRCVLLSTGGKQISSTECLLHQLHFRLPHGQQVRCGCLDGCKGLRSECTRPPEPAGHYCGNPTDNGQPMEVYCRQVSLQLARKLMVVKLVNASQRWWEGLEKKLTEYRICDHTYRLLRDVHVQAQREGTAVKLYDPDTGGYEIQTQGAAGKRSASPPPDVTRGSRSKPSVQQCSNTKCTCGKGPARGGRWQINTKGKKNDRNNRFDGETGLCPTCYRAHDRERAARREAAAKVSAAAANNSSDGTDPLDGTTTPLRPVQPPTSPPQQLRRQQGVQQQLSPAAGQTRMPGSQPTPSSQAASSSQPPQLAHPPLVDRAKVQKAKSAHNLNDAEKALFYQLHHSPSPWITPPCQHTATQPRPDSQGVRVVARATGRLVTPSVQSVPAPHTSRHAVELALPPSVSATQPPPAAGPHSHPEVHTSGVGVERSRPRYYESRSNASIS